MIMFYKISKKKQLEITNNKMVHSNISINKKWNTFKMAKLVIFYLFTLILYLLLFIFFINLLKD